MQTEMVIALPVLLSSQPCSDFLDLCSAHHEFLSRGGSSAKTPAIFEQCCRNVKTVGSNLLHKHEFVCYVYITEPSGFISKI